MMDIVKEIMGMKRAGDSAFAEAHGTGIDDCIDILDRAGIREGFPIERMIAFIRDIASFGLDVTPPTVSKEARAIHALIEPVDPDIAEASRIAAQFGASGESFEKPIIAAIKRGRELAESGK